jgi:hypothetical protein
MTLKDLVVNSKIIDFTVEHYQLIHDKDKLIIKCFGGRILADVTKEEYNQELTTEDLEYYLYKCFQIGYYEGNVDYMKFNG